MVGVPHSKACNPCRAQKKKCKGASAPCDRCKRLNIECVGLGVQRFTFKDESAKLRAHASELADGDPLTLRPKVAATSLVTSTFTCHRTLASKKGVHVGIKRLQWVQDDSGDSTFDKSKPSLYLKRAPFSLVKIPTTHLDLVAMDLSANLDISVGSKIGLVWNFGPFLEDLPSRLGHNKALDASVEAMLAAYDSFKSRTTMANISSVASTRAYCRALNAMRHALCDPEIAMSSETLCSTMIMLICESLNGAKDDWSGSILSHADGAASIIKARGYRKSANDFEERVLLSLRGPIIMLALFQNKQNFTVKQWKDLITNPLEGAGVDNRMMQTMAALPNLLHAVQNSYAAEPIDKEMLALATARLTTMRDLHILDRIEVSERMDKFETKCGMPPTQMPAQLACLHSHFGRQLGLAYAIEIYVNLILSGAARSARFQPWQRHLVDEHLIAADACVEDILVLADRVESHRPLGTMCMNFVLTAALTAALTDELKDRVELRAEDFIHDVYGDFQSRPSLCHLRELSQYLSCRDMRAWHLEVGFVDEPAVKGHNPHHVDLYDLMGVPKDIRADCIPSTA